ncbi:hypothetical protein K8I31_14870 [bacterium]|nr:hypothetical protein [bacterium]
MNDLCRQYRECYGETHVPPELAAHAEQCADCREFARKQEALSEMLPAWQSPEAAPDFALNVMARIAESQKGPQTLSQWFKHFFTMQLTVPLPAAAMASLLLVISLPMNVFFLSSQPETGLTGRQIAKAPIEQSANVSNPSHPTIPAGQVIQVNQTSSNVPGLSLPPNLYGAGAFLLIPIVDPMALTPPASETKTQNSSGI